MNFTRLLTPFRGRTTERTSSAASAHRATSGSRASSASSVRSMIDERLEWAHQERMRSTSRNRSLPPSPFHESSPFYAEYARGSSPLLRSRPTYVCECCPKSPQTFDNKTDFIHSLTAITHACPCCPSRFADHTAVEIHLRSDHQGTAAWSCAAIANPRDDFYHILAGLGSCSFCGADTPDYPSEGRLSAHLSLAHRFGKCKRAGKFFTADQFRQHLRNDHHVLYTTWVLKLMEACKILLPLDGHTEGTRTGVDSDPLPALTSRKRRISSSPTERDTGGHVLRGTKGFQKANHGSQSHHTLKTSSEPELPSGLDLTIVYEPTRNTKNRLSSFVCQICQQSFTRRTSLINHERTHTGEKPFACKIHGCDQTFTQQGDRTRHEQAQHGEKSFVCGGVGMEGLSWGCGKAFGRKDGLLEHHRKTAKGRKCLEEHDKIGDPDGNGVESRRVIV